MTLTNLRSVVRTETLLYMRGRGVWITVVLMVVLGLYVGTWARHSPWDSWGQFTTAALWMTLLLMFTTGDQITRDRDLRVQGVLLSTPLSTAAYVGGKYMAALLMLCGLAGVSLLTALGTDTISLWRSPYEYAPGPLIFGDNYFSSLGPWPYLAGWLWLMLMPLIFGAALVLAAITLMHGQRLVAYGAVLGFWLVPILAGSAWPDWLDVTAYKLSVDYRLASVTGVAQTLWRGFSTAEQRTAAETWAFHTALQHLPPVLPSIFFVNRLIFGALAATLILLTTALVARRRRAA